MKNIIFIIIKIDFNNIKVYKFVILLKMKIKIKFLHQDDTGITLVLNDFYTKKSYNFKEDSGIDLVFPENIIVKSGETKLIGLGIACEPEFHSGYYIYARSSISKTPLRLANNVGIIDMNYRGELKVAVDNIKDYDYEIKAGDRLFQICTPNLQPIQFTIVPELNITDRGDGGFGSTNKEKLIKIEWPESQRIMEHPDAQLVEDPCTSCTYMIPESVWNEYKDRYYGESHLSL